MNLPEDIPSFELDLPEAVEPSAPRAAELAVRWRDLQAARGALEHCERALIDEALASHGGVVTRAARALGIARTTLASRLAVRPSRGD